MVGVRMKKKPSVYHRLTVTIVSALIGAFVVPIVVLVVAGGLTFEEIKSYAIGGAVLFALLGFLFPKPMEKILFVLTLFQPS